MAARRARAGEEGRRGREALAASVPDSGGVVLVPAFTGLGAPYWDANARGTLLGLSRGSTGAHIARAALESIAMQSADLVEAMLRDGAAPLHELRVDGGAAANDLLMQMQARRARRAGVASTPAGDDRVRRGSPGGTRLRAGGLQA